MTNTTKRTQTAVADHISFQFRTLLATDGMALHQLVSDCPPLDPNSSYCNLLQSAHFQETSMAAINNGELMGSVSGYRIPDRPDCLFVWQVAVHPNARGQGLARTMLRKLLARLSSQGVHFIETSITPDNKASWRLFEGFAAENNAKLVRSVMFEHQLHFQGKHDTEYLVRIGPIEQACSV